MAAPGAVPPGAPPVAGAAAVAPAAAPPAAAVVPQSEIQAPVARPAPAGTPQQAEAAAGRGAPAQAAEPVAAAETGSVFIDFLNTYSEGAIEVEVDGRKRWSERLGISQQGGGLSKLKLQRVSEQIGSQLKIAAGGHKFTVTILNGDGEVRDFGSTSFQVAASRSVTLRVRTTRFKNQLQLDVVPGEPISK